MLADDMASYVLLLQLMASGLIYTFIFPAELYLF